MTEKVEIVDLDEETERVVRESTKRILQDSRRPDDSRRLKVLMLGEEVVVNIVLTKDFNPSHVLKLVDPTIPEGLEIIRVYHEPWDRCFSLLVRHDSFPVHQDGVPFEKIWPMWEVVAFSPKKEQ